MILVVGATGLVGQTVTRLLLKQGRDVRILRRSSADYQPLVDEGAIPVDGDLKDPASLEAACHGVDVVVTTATAGQRGGADTPETVDLHGNRNLIDAARAAKARQLVFVSALAADEGSPVPLLRAKAHSEASLRASGLPYTILAPNGFMDVTFPLVIGRPAQEGREVILVGEGRRRHSFVAARDVAAFVAAVVGRPSAVGRRILIGGPEPISFRDAVAAYERAIGRPIAVRTIAPGEILPNLPPADGLAELVSALLASLETFDSPLEMGAIAQEFGVPLTSLDEFVRGDIARAFASTTA